jgi:hypothetical protein
MVREVKAVAGQVASSSRRQASVNVASGGSHDSNGDALFTATGVSLFADPVANFMIFLRGTFSWRFDPMNGALLDLSGHGKVSDVCAMID